MRFIYNKFPDDKLFQPDEAWLPLKESTNLWIVQLQSVPFILLNGGIMVGLMLLMGVQFELNTTTMLLSFLIFLPIHELLHAVFFPEGLQSDKVFLGFTTKGFVPFAAYTGEMKRNTFITVLLAPFIIISALGLLYLVIFGSHALIEHIIVFNAIGASADCLGVFHLMRQVPKYAVVRNKQVKTYWKAEG